MLDRWAVAALRIPMSSFPASSRLKHTTYTSSVISNSLNPHWDESFSFDVLRWRLAAYPISLQVYDDDLLSKDDLLGAVDLQLNDALITDIHRGGIRV